MGTITKTYNFSAGAPIIAAEHNVNFTTLYDWANGNIDTTNINANAGIVDTQLAQITTPSKVSGAALTSLASIPAGAGAIPVANLSAVTATSHEMIFIHDGGGAVISTGVKGDVRMPFDGDITGVYVLADQSGSLVLDLWLDDQGAFPPTIADTITASAKPTLSSATNYSDTTLSGWTKAITAGDILRINVDSCTTITRFTLAITFTRDS